MRIGIIILIVLLLLFAIGAAVYVMMSGSGSDVAIATPAYIAPARSQLPSGISEGDVIQCPTTMGVYKIVNGKKSWYSGPVWNKYGNPAYRQVSCGIVDSIESGPDMV